MESKESNTIDLTVPIILNSDIDSDSFKNAMENGAYQNILKYFNNEFPLTPAQCYSGDIINNIIYIDIAKIIGRIKSIDVEKKTADIYLYPDTEYYIAAQMEYANYVIHPKMSVIHYLDGSSNKLLVKYIFGYDLLNLY